MRTATPLRTALAALVACVALGAPTEAQALPARTIQGERVETADYLVLSWSMYDAASVAALRAVSGREGVLAVNVDSPQDRSRLRPFLNAQGIVLPVVCDPGQGVEADVQASEGGDVVLLALQERFGPTEAVLVADARSTPTR